MDIQRVNSYADERFPQAVLRQHGAYLADGVPCWVEIVAPDTAVVQGTDPTVFPELIEAFRFHAPHIVRFQDGSGRLISAFPAPALLTVPVAALQPSQFYVDADKLQAVASFVHRAEDIVVQVLPWEGRYIALDGHTRLYLAVQRGYAAVQAVVSDSDDWVWPFVAEARRRGIHQPRDMQLLPHDQYEVEWNQYCDRVFAGEKG